MEMYVKRKIDSGGAREPLARLVRTLTPLDRQTGVTPKPLGKRGCQGA